MYMCFSASTKSWQLFSTIIQGKHLNSSFGYSVARSVFFLLNNMYLTVELEHYIYATNQVSQISLSTFLIKICCSTWGKKEF